MNPGITDSGGTERAVLSEIEPNRRGGFSRLYSVNAATGGVSETEGHLFLKQVRDHTSNKSITIFHINDIHHNLLKTDDWENCLKKKPEELYSPLARIESEILKTREAGENVLFLSAGDDHIGSPLDLLCEDSEEEYQTSPVYRAFSKIGMDAVVLGNHDFDLSPSVLSRVISNDASFPVLSANITVPEKKYHPAIIGTAGNAVIGIIGITTLEELHLKEDAHLGIVLEHPKKEAQRYLRLLEPYCDLIILLSHLGFNEPNCPMVEYDDKNLSKDIEEISSIPILIIGGHTHKVIHPEKEETSTNRIPIFQAGCFGDHLGRIDVKIPPPLLMPKTRFFYSGIITPINNSPQNNWKEALFIKTEILPLYKKLNKKMTTLVCRFDSDGTAGTQQTLEDRLTGESSILNSITDSVAEYFKNNLDFILKEGSPYPPEENIRLLAACDTAGIVGGFDSIAEIKYNDFYKVLPYTDTVYYSTIKGSDLCDILASNSKRLIGKTLLKPYGGSIDLMDWSKISRGFLQFSSSLRYTVSVDREGGSVVSSFYNGVPIDRLYNEIFVLLLNSHTALGYQGWSPRQKKIFTEFGGYDITRLNFKDTQIGVRKAVIEIFKKSGLKKIERDGRLTLSDVLQQGVK